MDLSKQCNDQVTNLVARLRAFEKWLWRFPKTDEMGKNLEKLADLLEFAKSQADIQASAKGVEESTDSPAYLRVPISHERLLRVVRDVERDIQTSRLFDPENYPRYITPTTFEGLFTGARESLRLTRHPDFDSPPPVIGRWY